MVFGLPRSGTTIIQSELSRICNINNYIEAYSGKPRDDVYQWTSKWNQGITKILTTNINNYKGQLNIVKLFNQNFDGLVVIQRSNLTDCIVSLYYADNVSKKYHYRDRTEIKLIPFVFDLSQTRYFEEIKTYFQTLDTIKQAGINYDIFDYDQWCQGKTQMVLNQKIIVTDKPPNSFINSNLDYKTLCQNYQDVHEVVDNLLNEIKIC